jgi:phosphoribosylaminoimidazole (AIR) synthetase
MNIYRCDKCGKIKKRDKLIEITALTGFHSETYAMCKRCYKEFKLWLDRESKLPKEYLDKNSKNIGECLCKTCKNYVKNI